MQKSIINKNGYIVGSVFVDKNNCILKNHYVLKEDEQLVPQYTTFNYCKPRWKNNEWVEGATDEEIQAFKEGNTTTEKEPSEQEKLNAQLLEEIAQQKIVNAQLMQEIATLKGGTANV